MEHEEKVGNAPEGGGGNIEQDPEVWTRSVARKVNPTKPGYMNFDPGGMLTMNRRPIGSQVSKYSRPPRGKPS